MSNYILAPELNKIAFLPQLTSNFSELTVDLFDACFERGRAVPAVPSILSLFQPHVTRFTVSETHFCGPVVF